MENIGREIKGLIKKEKVSVYKMAEDLGIFNEAVYRSLSDNGNPRWKTVKQFLDYLGYDVKFVKRRHRRKKRRSA
jgi:DNA-binding phage protein